MTVTSFAELTWMVAANWKSADKETKDYCVEVARILKARHAELTKVGGIGCLSAIDSISPGPREEAKPRNADSETQEKYLTNFGAKFCLPTMDSVSPGLKNDTKRRKAQLPITATHAFGDQPSHLFNGLHDSTGIFPTAHGKNNINIRDGSRTWLMDLIDQYHRDQAASIPNTTPMWGNDSLNHTTINMPQPMPSGVIQETIRTASMPIMTGNAVSQTGTDHQGLRHEFRAIMNASKRASISNMMTSQRRAPMPHGIRGFKQQPNPNFRRHSAPECQNPSELDSSRAIYDVQELDVADSNIRDMWRSSKVQESRAPMPHGIRGFEQQPNPNFRRHSAPECQNPSELESSRAMYDVQELDVADSNIRDMWRSSKVQEIDEF